MEDWNPWVVKAFRANQGIVGDQWEGVPLLLLTTTGAKSGQARVAPLMYQREGERLFIFASRGGSPTDPDWYRNLVAHPEVTVEIGAERYAAVAKTITGRERDQIYARWSQRYPVFGEFQEKTSRNIPVVELVRAQP